MVSSNGETDLEGELELLEPSLEFFRFLILVIEPKKRFLVMMDCIFSHFSDYLCLQHSQHSPQSTSSIFVVSGQYIKHMFNGDDYSVA